MELQNQNTQVIVTYGPYTSMKPFAKTYPAIVEISPTTVGVYTLSPDRLTRLETIFESPVSQVQRVSFTPWFASIKTDSTKCVVEFRSKPSLPKEYGDWSDAFGVTSIFKKINLLSRTFRSVGIKTRNYTYIVLAAFFAILIVNIPNFTELYRSFFKDF